MDFNLSKPCFLNAPAMTSWFPLGIRLANHASHLPGPGRTVCLARLLRPRRCSSTQPGARLQVRELPLRGRIRDVRGPVRAMLRAFHRASHQASRGLRAHEIRELLGRGPSRARDVGELPDRGTLTRECRHLRCGGTCTWTRGASFEAVVEIRGPVDGDGRGHDGRGHKAHDGHGEVHLD